MDTESLSPSEGPSLQEEDDNANRGGVAGVETNESSRFIDHTVATDWESFIADIEQGLRTLMENYKSIHKFSQRVDVNYQDQVFALELRQVMGMDYRYKHPPSCFAVGKRNWIQSMLRHDLVICFYRRSPKLYSQPDGTKVITVGNTMNAKAAFTIAVKSVIDLTGLPVPALYAYDVLAEGGVTEVTTGYYNDTLTKRSLSYDCYLYDQLSKNRALFFFDGIRKLYFKKVAAMNAHRPLLGDRFQTLAVNYYDYDLSLWQAHHSALDSPSSAPQLDYFQNIFTAAFRGYFNAHYPLSRLKGYSLVSISSVQVQLSYREKVQQSVLDNESYSTFIGSRQHHSNYRLVPVYTHSNLSLVAGDGVVVSSGSGKSSGSGRGTSRPVDAVVLASSLDSNALHMIQSMSWRSANLRKMLMLFITSSLQMFKTFDMASDRSGPSSSASTPAASPHLVQVPKDLVAHLRDHVLSEETRKALAVHDDFLSYQHSMQHIANTMHALSDRTLSKHRNASNISYSSMTASPPPTAATVTSGSVSYGYSNSPKPTTEDDSRQEDQAMQSILAYLFDEVKGAAEEEAEGARGGGQQGDQMSRLLEQLALLVSFLPTVKLSFVIKLWQQCLREMQDAMDSQQLTEGAEATSKGQRFLNLPSVLKTTGTTASSKQANGTANNNSISIASGDSPLYEHSLWEDVLSSKQAAGTPCAVPDLEASLLVQKLQMVAFCHTVAGSQPVCQVINSLHEQEGEGDGHGVSDELRQSLQALGAIPLTRRVPLTSDLIYLQQHIASKFTGDSTDSSSAKDSFLRYHVCMPALLTDMRSFRAKAPDASVDVFLHWYGLNELLCHCDEGNKLPDPPAIVSQGGQLPEPVPEREAEDEELALSVPTEDLSMLRMDDSPIVLTHKPCTNAKNCAALKDKVLEVWDQAAPDVDGNSETAQSYGFSAKKEADKALLYLEKIPINALLLELLVHITHALYAILAEECAHAFMTSEPRVQRRLTKLRASMSSLEESSMYIRKECILNRKGSRDSLISMTIQIIKQAESVIAGFEALENIVIRAYLFNTFVHSVAPAADSASAVPRHLAYVNIEEGAYTLTSDLQSSEVLRTMKSISKAGSGGHDWYSYDGRELGMPTARKFVIKAQYLDEHSSSNGNAAGMPRKEAAFMAPQNTTPRLGTPKSLIPSSVFPPRSPMAGTKLDFTESDEGGDKDLDEEPADVEMVALVDQQQLRLAFIIRELD